MPVRTEGTYPYLSLVADTRSFQMTTTSVFKLQTSQYPASMCDLKCVSYSKCPHQRLYVHLKPTSGLFSIEVCLNIPQVQAGSDRRLTKGLAHGRCNCYLSSVRLVLPSEIISSQSSPHSVRLRLFLQVDFSKKPRNIFTEIKRPMTRMDD